MQAVQLGQRCVTAAHAGVSRRTSRAPVAAAARHQLRSSAQPALRSRAAAAPAARAAATTVAMAKGAPAAPAVLHHHATCGACSGCAAASPKRVAPRLRRPPAPRCPPAYRCSQQAAKVGRGQAGGLRGVLHLRLRRCVLSFLRTLQPARARVLRCALRRCAPARRAWAQSALDSAHVAMNRRCVAVAVAC